MSSTFSHPSFTEILRYLFKKRYYILLIPSIGAILITALSYLFVEDMYVSRANLLPNSHRGMNMSGLSQGDSNIQSLASSVLSGQSSETSRFEILLSSYNLKKRAVEKFDLIERYDTEEAIEPLGTAIDILSSNTEFFSTERGNFIIKVWSKDPELAQDIADFYVAELNDFNTEIASSEATHYRKHIEDRYRKAQRDLNNLRDSLQAFQKKYGIYELPTQVKSYFSLISGFTEELIKTDIKKELLRESVNPDNTTYKKAVIEYDIIENKLNEILSNKGNRELLINYRKLPTISKKYFDLRKELEIQAKIQEFLVPMYEQAKLEEEKALPIVTVVDKPIVPKTDDYPSRLLILILSGLSLLILTLIFFVLFYSVSVNTSYFRYIVNKE